MFVSVSISEAIQRLNEWEEQLKPWFKTITLLGEIPLSNEDVEEIGTLLRSVGKMLMVRIRWPHTLVVFMAAVAARNEKVEYWAVLADSMGMKQTQQFQSHFGIYFSGFLAGCEEKYQIPSFGSVGGYRYVTPIRLHGGIPAYSLPDFFAEVVLPAVRKPDYVGMGAKELIPLVLERSVVRVFVDSPVRYFLEHGGLAAEKFFDRCLAMARRWDAEGAGLSAQELGLPRYVVTTFEAFMEGQTRTAGGRRLRAPRLVLNPTYGDSLYSLELPAQPVDVEQTSWRYLWRLQALGMNGIPLNNHENEEPVRVRRSGYDLVTEERELPLFLPPCRLSVALEATPPGGQPQVLGRWRLSLAPTVDEPILAFRVGDGAPVRSQTLPTETLWLLYPSHARLEISGEGHYIQHFPALLGAWREWQIGEWDLRQARSLVLVDEKTGQPLGQPLAVHRDQEAAQLVGDNQLAGLHDTDNVPLFVGAPPVLWLPQLTGESTTQEMEQWEVTITPRWVTRSLLRGEQRKPLSHWRSVVKMDKGGFALPLATLLGPTALGSFAVEVRGPRNFQQELRLRLWSHLSIHGLRPYYLPGSQGASAVHFTVGLAAGQRVATPAGEKSTTVSQGDQADSFSIIVAPESSQAVIELVGPGDAAEDVRMTLRLTIPRLRWLLRLGDDQPEWHTQPTDLPVARLLQSAQRDLILDWVGVGQVPACTLLLQDATQHPPQILREEEMAQSAGTVHRQMMVLEHFHDTVQGNTDVPILSLALRVREGAGDSILPLFHLKRSLDVQTAILDWSAKGEVWVHWDAPHRLRNRRLRIWSAWRPWEEAQEYLIPDDTPRSHAADGAGSGMLCLPVSLPIGWYLISLRAAYGWETLHAPPLPTEDAILSREGDWELRVLELEEIIEADEKGSLNARWELAAICHEVGRIPGWDKQIKWLSSHLEIATVRQLIALRRWMQKYDPYSAKALRMRMYGEKQIQRLLHEEDDETIHLAYLEEINHGTISLPTAHLLLHHMQQPEIIGPALLVLLKQDVAGAVKYLLEEMAWGGYSHRDALQLLKKNATESFIYLKKAPHSPARDRLLLDLAKEVPNPGLVQVGEWVRSEAGWGRIERIEIDGREHSFCFAEDNALLCVLLRADAEHEEIEIDTASRTIRFTQAQQVHHCTKEGCRGFRSYSDRIVRDKHNRSAHMGLGAAYQGKPACSPYQRPLAFSPQPPADQYE